MRQHQEENRSILPPSFVLSEIFPLGFPTRFSHGDSKHQLRLRHTNVLPKNADWTPQSSVDTPFPRFPRIVRISPLMKPIWSALIDMSRATANDIFELFVVLCECSSRLARNSSLTRHRENSVYRPPMLLQHLSDSLGRPNFLFPQERVVNSPLKPSSVDSVSRLQQMLRLASSDALLQPEAHDQR